MGAFINNFQSPIDLDELKDSYYNWSAKTNLEALLDDCRVGYTVWSVDKTVRKGDMVFFMCAAMSKSHMGHVRVLARQDQTLDPNIRQFAEQAYVNYKKHARHIICIGKLAGDPYSTTDNSGKTRWWADIKDLLELPNTISLDDFRGFIKLNSFGSVTHLKQDQLEKLAAVIVSKNPGINSDELRNLVSDEITNEFQTKYEESFKKEQQERKKKKSTTTAYDRDHALVKQLKELYEYKCQLCNNHFDIPKDDGTNYVEVHHIIPNSIGYDEEGNTVDQPGNMIVVCPNHHRYLHYHKGGDYKLLEKNGDLYLANNEDEVKVIKDYHLKKWMK